MSRLEPDEIVVASFNIRNGLGLDGLNSWPFRRASTVATIHSLDAEIIGLQEVYGFQWRYVSRNTKGYRAVGAGRRDGRRGEHCTVMARDPIEIVSDATRWFGDAPDRPGSRLPGASFPRVMTIARCRHVVSGRELDVANAHLDERVAELRARSAAQLVEWLDTRRPAVLLGDLNTTADDDTVMGPLRRAGFVPAPLEGGTNHDFTGRTDGLRLDHILVRSGERCGVEVLDSAVRSERVGRRLPSDHWPVVARLRLSDA